MAATSNISYLEIIKTSHFICKADITENHNIILP